MADIRCSATSQMLDLAIIIVNFNTRDYLRNCLTSIYDSRGDFTFEVCVVDNASSDGSVDVVRDEFPQVRLIANTENVGFAQANNQAIQATDTPYLATLNNDTRPDPTWLEHMVGAMEADAGIGMVAAKVLYWESPHPIDSAGIELDRRSGQPRE